MYITLIVILIIALTFIAYLNINPQFGAKVTTSEKRKLQASSNWKDGKFLNLAETNLSIKPRDIPKMLKQRKAVKKIASPKKGLTILPFDKEIYHSNTKPKFIWYGHSVLLVQLDGKNILIDPMLGEDASPIAPMSTKRFSRDTLSIIDEIPTPYIVLLTHDHYDHLDYKSIKKLKDKVPVWHVALGVARHLIKWGVPKENITEFDWWDNKNFGDLSITFTPSRHFSGRGLTDRAKSLWGGWVLKTKDNAIYWSGDGGYGEHFKEVQQKFGSFDWMFVECGQYNELWHDIHLYPEEAVEAAINSKATTTIPVHWAGFALALHDWKDPINRFVASAQKNNLNISTPKLGEIVTLGDETKHSWWTEIK